MVRLEILLFLRTSLFDRNGVFLLNLELLESTLTCQSIPIVDLILKLSEVHGRVEAIHREHILILLEEVVWLVVPRFFGLVLLGRALVGRGIVD